MDGEESIPSIVGTLEHGLKLERFELRQNCIRLGIELAPQSDVFLRLRFRELTQLPTFCEPPLERAIGLEAFLERLYLLDRAPRPVGVGPEGAFSHDLFQLCESPVFPVDVKGSSAVQRDGALIPQTGHS
jgi:hypothetical protein